MNADLEDVNASTEYIQYSESSTGDISTKALNKAEVDGVISSLANTSSNGSTVEINSSAKTSNSVLKKTMLATNVKINGKKKTSCTYVCSWLKSPSQRMIDVASIGWGSNQGSFDSTSSFYANYSCIDTITYYKKKSNSNDYKKYTETESYEYNITSSMRKDASENGLYCKSKLKADENDSAGSTTYYHSYNNHTFTMGFYLTNVSNISHTYFRGVYSHQKKKSSFKIDSISVNFGITGVPSISISGGYKKETYYSDIGDVLLLNHVY
ncbi:MAG: hypothetical protein LUC25_07360 [Ruminococcus sp.]|nr:hypothetical protein [Ruminococcus sp.]